MANHQPKWPCCRRNHQFFLQRVSGTNRLEGGYFEVIYFDPSILNPPPFPPYPQRFRSNLKSVNMCFPDQFQERLHFSGSDGLTSLSTPTFKKGLLMLPSIFYPFRSSTCLPWKCGTVYVIILSHPVWKGSAVAPVADLPPPPPGKGGTVLGLTAGVEGHKTLKVSRPALFALLQISPSLSRRWGGGGG
jgi:hypothetical protein